MQLLGHLLDNKHGIAMRWSYESASCNSFADAFRILGPLGKAAEITSGQRFALRP